MANTEVFQGIHLKNPETGTEYRLISVYDGMAVLCVMNIKSLKIDKLSLKILRTYGEKKVLISCCILFAI